MKIAIDGTAASGKGTLSENLSKEFKLPRLDTGLLYRKLAFIYINSLKLKQIIGSISGDIGIILMENKIGYQCLI